MKAKVIFKRDGRASLLLANGQVMRMTAPVAKKLHPAMQLGDTGDLYPDHTLGRWRFEIDATDVLPIEIPRDIIIPT